MMKVENLPQNELNTNQNKKLEISTKMDFVLIIVFFMFGILILDILKRLRILSRCVPLNI